MFSQEDIDAVLNAAQTAVDALADETDDLGVGSGSSAPNVRPQPAAMPPPASAQNTAPAAVAVAEAPPPRPSAGRSAAPARKPDRSSVARILKLRVPVVVRLAERKMLLSEILKIVPGTILEFSRTVDEELDLMVNNYQIGAGVAVKVNERFGLRVTYVGDLRQRIESLGS